MTDPRMRSTRDLPAAWREQADALRPFNAGAAVAFERAAAELETALRVSDDELLTLATAALASGFSADHLRHLIANGTIPNAGRRGAPRIRRADLPRRPGAGGDTPGGEGPLRPRPSGYDPAADALALMRRRHA